MFHRLYLLVLCIFNASPGQRCVLNSRSHFGEPLPVFLRNGRLLEPDDRYGNVEMNSGDTLTLSCGSSGPISHPNAIRQLRTATITCEAGDNFRNDDWLNAPASFSQFRCQDPPDYNSQRTNQSCFNGHQIYEVGYQIDNQWHPVYQSCFDEDVLRPVYSKYTQKPYNAMFQTRVDRPYFKADGNYRTIPVESLFSPWGQRAAIGNLVGSAIDRYVTRSEEMSRGHLAAKTDFVFAFGERATFHYVNCAPQWKNFNGGNWNTLEVDLRNHVHAAGYNTILYTGTFGVTSLINQYGERVDLYLANDNNNNPIIPVPQYYYKVVYDTDSRKGIAFVGINNPYYTSSEARDLFFCEDLCRGNPEFRWLTWRPDNPSEGYTFCCRVEDFRRTVNHLPEFEVTGLLT
ncbi:uncharacterized protein LOC134747488 [Cydia strobilella]|uniref:uncharacterized protein LOC134747488 n=1 Tax=Cydia strobilella TaxID=1100964 RepID=UPI0030041D4C